MNAFDFRRKDEKAVDPVIEAWATRTIGAAIEVHLRLGPGLPEVAYREALSHEMTLREIPHVCEAAVPIFYKGVKIAEGKVDLLVAGTLVVELKVIDELGPIQTAQVISYLSALRLPLGLLINFNVLILKDGLKRVIKTL